MLKYKFFNIYFNKVTTTSYYFYEPNEIKRDYSTMPLIMAEQGYFTPNHTLDWWVSGKLVPQLTSGGRDLGRYPYELVYLYKDR